MRLFDFFRLNRRQSKSADEAKKRLSVLVALDRDNSDVPDFLPLMQRELLDVIRKYVEVDKEKVSVELERSQEFSTLEVNIELPPNVAKNDGISRAVA